MGDFVLRNERLFPKKDVVVSAQNRSFRYGDGLFETIRCRHGYPLWIEHHWERLQQSSKILKIQLPAYLTRQKLVSLIHDLLQANKHTAGARVRLSLFRSDGGFYLPADNTGGLVIESSMLEKESYFLNKEGLKVGLYPEMQKSFNMLSPLKTTSALLYIMASMYAEEKGWDDIILCNDANCIAEAGSSNLFMIEKGKLLTPSLDQACVDGVMRRVLLDLAGKQKYTVMECALLPEDLLRADELFITNAIHGIQWIKGLEHKRYYHDFSSSFIKLLEAEADHYLVENFL